MSLAPGAQLGPYEILAPLGAGGMGEVYRARDTRLAREVAVKILPEHLAADPEALMRFEREAKAVAALSHPNIVAIHDIGQAHGLVYAVLELLEGEPLRAVLARGPLPPSKAVDYARQIAHGLAAAHDRDIVHRDLKPENLFLTPDGRVEILDFGIAKLPTEPVTSDSPTVASGTQAGAILGTLDYMSPEQMRGGPVDHRTDLFSFGAVLYEMLTGKSAFHAESPADTIGAVLREDPVSALRVRTGVPEGLVRIVRRCLEKRPGERFQSARDLAFALDDLRRDLDAGRGTAPASGSSRGPSIAVLPFADLSPHQDQDYFCEGMAEEIVNALTKVEGLHVAARTSAFQFKGRAQDVRAIGAALDVETVLEGSVRTAGTRLRVIAQLIDVADGYHLWSERYDRQMDDVFAIQDEIAAAIADRLKVRLVTAREGGPAKRPTENLEAYTLYLKGRYFHARFNRDGFSRARECFERAIAADPAFAHPYAGLAAVHVALAILGWVAPRDVMPAAWQAVRQALALDDGISEAHQTLGSILHYYEWDWSAAEREYRRAVELNPDDPIGRRDYAQLLVQRGRPDEAIAEAQQGIMLDPLALTTHRVLVTVLYFSGRFDEALEEARRTLELEPAYFAVRWFQAAVFIGQHAYDDALEAIEAGRVYGQGDPILDGMLGLTYGLAGRPADARRVADELQRHRTSGYFPASCIGWVFMGLGEADEAMSWFTRAFEEKDGMCSFYGAPLYAPIRGDVRFQDLVRRIGLAPAPDTEGSRRGRKEG